MHDHDLRPEERLRELAAIFARGLTRLNQCKIPQPKFEEKTPQNSEQKPLEFSSEKRRHVLTG